MNIRIVSINHMMEVTKMNLILIKWNNRKQTKQSFLNTTNIH